MRWGVACVGWVLIGLLAGGAGVAEGRVEKPLTVALGGEATLVDPAGRSVDLTVTVGCQPGHSVVLEAFIYVTQPGFTSQFAGIPVRCGGQPRTHLVRVAAFPESPFHRGEAFASAYVLLLDRKSGQTESGNASRPITIRSPRARPARV